MSAPSQGASQSSKDRHEDYAAVAGELVRTGVLTLSICAVAYFIWFARSPPGQPDSWGQLGDFLGGVAGTIIALLTLWAIGQAMKLQQTEFQTMHRALDAQASAARIAAFESTFFKVLARLTNMTEGPNAPVYSKGMVEQISNGSRLDRSTNPIESLDREYCELFDRQVAELGPYFRTLYFLLELIEKEKALTESEKFRYAKFVRAQLSSYELVLILLNIAFNAEGKEGLKPYVERFSLLKHSKGIETPDGFAILRSNRNIIHPRAFASSEERESNNWN